MLFDKKIDEVLSDDEEARARRVREEQAARERMQREIEDGRRHRQERQEVARRFREQVQDSTPTGRAKAAIDSGDRLFQLVLPLSLDTGAGASPEADHNPTLNAIEAMGWRLATADYVSQPPTRTVPPEASPEEHASVFAIYVFRRSI
jgi:hypothetical protein